MICQLIMTGSVSYQNYSIQTSEHNPGCFATAVSRPKGNIFSVNPFMHQTQNQSVVNWLMTVNPFFHFTVPYAMFHN